MYGDDCTMTTDNSKLEKIEYELKMAERGNHRGYYSYGSLKRFHEQAKKIKNDDYLMSLDEYIKQMAT